MTRPAHTTSDVAAGERRPRSDEERLGSGRRAANMAAVGPRRGNRERSPARRGALAAGLLLALGATVFMLAALIGELVASDYSVAGNFISDLGVIAETAWFFNAAVIVAGLLVLAGGLVLRPVLNSLPITLSLAVGGIACALIGVIRLDVAKSVHEIIALIALASLNILPAATAPLFKGWMRPITVAVSLAGLGLVLVLTLRYTGVIETAGWTTLGGLERLVVYPAQIWLLVFAGYLLARGSVRGSSRP